MGKWVVTVAGIAILSVLCDVILPEGQTRKYIRTVFGVVVSLVIVSPLVTLFSNGFNTDIVDSDTVAAQQGYLDSVAEREKRYALSSVELLLKNKGITVKNIELNSSDNTSSFDGMASNDVILLEITSPYSNEQDIIIRQVVEAYFPNVELVTIWGSV